MTRENKAGLVVCGSFLCLIAAVVVVKLRQPSELGTPPPAVGPGRRPSTASSFVHGGRKTEHPAKSPESSRDPATKAPAAVASDAPKARIPNQVRLADPAPPPAGPPAPTGPNADLDRPAGAAKDGDADASPPIPPCRPQPRRLGRSHRSSRPGRFAGRRGGYGRCAVRRRPRLPPPEPTHNGEKDGRNKDKEGGGRRIRIRARRRNFPRRFRRRDRLRTSRRRRPERRGAATRRPGRRPR